MTQRIDIPVDANVGAIRQKFDQVGKTIEHINRIKWSPINVDKLDRDISRIEQRLRRLSATGNYAAGAPAPRPAGTGGAPSAVTYQPGQFRARQRYAIPPTIGDVPRSFFGGMGGGFGQIGAYGMRGARLGASGAGAEGEGGGMLGGAMGLLKGTGIGALVYGALKIGQGVSQGVDMATERGGQLDTLKRQMGDLGVSFDRLKQVSEEATTGLRLNSLEFSKLMLSMNRASRGTYGTPGELMGATTTSAGLARAFGMDPGAVVGMMGGMRNIDPRQNNRELALMIGESITRSGMASRPEDVMQAIMSFSTAASRLSLSAPNLGAFGGAYSDMMKSGITGLTPELTSQILMQANSAMSGMGQAGEPGQALTLAAMRHSGRSMNPLEASIMAGGGLFGTRASVFGKGTAEGAVLGKRGEYLAGGTGSDKTNFELIRDQMRRMGGGVEFQQEMLQKYFGSQTPEQAGALMQLKGTQIKGFAEVLKRAGVNPNQVNAESVQTIADLGDVKMGTPGARAQLESIYGKMQAQGNLTKEDTTSIEAARSGGSDQDLQNALVKAGAVKDVADDQYTVQKEISAKLDDLKIAAGDKVVQGIALLGDTLITLGGGHKTFLKEQVNDINEQADDAIADARREMKKKVNVLSPDYIREWNATEYQVKQINSQRANAIAAAQQGQDVNITLQFHGPNGTPIAPPVKVSTKPGTPVAVGVPPGAAMTGAPQLLHQ